MTQESFVVTLCPVGPDDRPGAVRLKLALKYVLRAYGLKCTRLSEARADASTPYTTGQDEGRGVDKKSRMFSA